jgi:hypothetical protein
MPTQLPNSPDPGLWLHLFTSSIRELYIADAIDLVAEPCGAIFRFRYERKYVNQTTRGYWEQDTLVGHKVGINFSLQHPADFHPAMFVPLRTGTVVSTQVEGDTYIIRFRLTQYLPLKDQPDWEPRRRKGPVHAYTEGLKIVLGPSPETLVTLGPSPETLVSTTEDSGKAFATIVRFLTSTLSFSPRVFWRIARVTRDATGASVDLDDEGNLLLTGGQGYTLHLAHYQYQPNYPESELSVFVPEAVDLVGTDKIFLRSRYDVIPIRFFPPRRDDVISGEISITTELPSKGPTVRIPVIVSPSAGQAVSGPLLGVAGAIALAIPAVLASDRLLLLRVGLVAVGAVVAGWALWLRRQYGLPG